MRWCFLPFILLILVGCGNPPLTPNDLIGQWHLEPHDQTITFTFHGISHIHYSSMVECWAIQNNTLTFSPPPTQTRMVLPPHSWTLAGTRDRITLTNSTETIILTRVATYGNLPGSGEDALRDLGTPQPCPRP
jgi:hypothetical protein